MRVRLTLFRRDGKRLSDRDIENSPPLMGDLTMSAVADPKGFHKRADLNRPAGEGPPSGLTEHLATLFEPELVSISHDHMLIRGLEKRAGAAYLQEWKVEIA